MRSNNALIPVRWIFFIGALIMGIGPQNVIADEQVTLHSAILYLDKPENGLPPIQPPAESIADLGDEPAPKNAAAGMGQDDGREPGQ